MYVVQRFHSFRSEGSTGGRVDEIERNVAAEQKTLEEYTLFFSVFFFGGGEMGIYCQNT